MKGLPGSGRQWQTVRSYFREVKALLVAAPVLAGVLAAPGEVPAVSRDAFSSLEESTHFLWAQRTPVYGLFHSDGCDAGPQMFALHAFRDPDGKYGGSRAAALGFAVATLAPWSAALAEKTTLSISTAGCHH